MATLLAIILCVFVCGVLIYYYLKERHLNKATFDAYKEYKRQRGKRGFLNKFMFVYQQKLREYRIDEEIHKIMNNGERN